MFKHFMMDQIRDMRVRDTTESVLHMYKITNQGLLHDLAKELNTCK